MSERAGFESEQTAGGGAGEDGRTAGFVSRPGQVRTERFGPTG